MCIKNIKYLLVLFLIFSFLKIEASEIDGTIDATYNSALLCTNDSCTTGTQINFKPTLGNQIHITDTLVTGNAWSEDFGWINFNPTISGVTNTSSGVLGGYAWGDTTGWINFAPTLGGVTIDTSGQFVGHAWSENYGWIKFDCNIINACVETDWRPLSVRSSGGGSSGGYLPPKPVEVASIIEPAALPISVSIVKKPVIKTLPLNNTPGIENLPDENNFTNPQPKEPPRITPSKKIIPYSDSTGQNNSNLKKYLFKNIFFTDIISFIKGNIFSRYFMGISFYYEIFKYKGYLNPFWFVVFIIIILWWIFFLLKRRKKT